MRAPPALVLVCAFATISSTRAAEPYSPDTAAQEKPSPPPAELDFPRAECSGNPHAAAAGPPANCPQIDADLRPAADAPEQDFPEWLGAVTGWWGPRTAGEEARKKRSGFIVTPIINSSPLIGAGFGAGIAGTVDLREGTRPSKYSTSVVFTTNSQISVPLRVDLTLPGGDWTAVLLWRLSRWPAPTWGLGGQTPDSARAVIDRDSLRLHQTVNRRLTGDLYAGAGLYLDYDFNVHDRGTASGVPSAFAQYPYGTGSSSFSLGPGVRLAWDDRDSVVYPTRGVYANLTYSFFPTWLGSSNSWQTLFAEARTYVPMSRRLVLALWTYGWASFGQVPYLRLPSIGSEPEGRSGRGYIEGRHIGKALLYGEAELRVLVWEWLGAAGGVNLHSVSQPGAHGIFQDAPRFQYWYPAILVGLKIAVVKESHANLNFDLAFGKASSGFYINFAESF